MDPTIGRFTQSDPAQADANNYAYCGSDPVNRTDPMGTDWSWTSGSGSNYAWVWVPSTWGGSKVQENPPPGVTKPGFTPDSSVWGQTIQGETYLNFDEYNSIGHQLAANAARLNAGLASLSSQTGISLDRLEYLQANDPQTLIRLASDRHDYDVRESQPGAQQANRQAAGTVEIALALSMLIPNPIDFEEGIAAYDTRLALGVTETAGGAAERSTAGAKALEDVPNLVSGGARNLSPSSIASDILNSTYRGPMPAMSARPQLELEEPNLYRGVPAGTDRYTDALQGVVRPRGNALCGVSQL